MAHFQLAILPGPLDSAFIVTVIIALPIVAVALLRRDGRMAWLLLMSFVASFAYGALSHFVLAGPDNALGLGGGLWAVVFLSTTVVLAVLEAVGSIVALALVARLRTLSEPAAPPA